MLAALASLSTGNLHPFHLLKEDHSEQSIKGERKQLLKHKKQSTNQPTKTKNKHQTQNNPLQTKPNNLPKNPLSVCPINIVIPECNITYKIRNIFSTCSWAIWQIHMFVFLHMQTDCTVCDYKGEICISAAYNSYKQFLFWTNSLLKSTLVYCATVLLILCNDMLWNGNK